MTPTGKSAGSCGKRSCNASGPPVEVPIATISGTTRKCPNRISGKCVAAEFITGSHMAPRQGRYPNSRSAGKVVLHRALHRDRKSTRLNSSHLVISYAVFCLKKKNKSLHTRRRVIYYAAFCIHKKQKPFTHPQKASQHAPPAISNTHRPSPHPAMHIFTQPEQ